MTAKESLTLNRYAESQAVAIARLEEKVDAIGQKLEDRKDVLEKLDRRLDDHVREHTEARQKAEEAKETARAAALQAAVNATNSRRSTQTVLRVAYMTVGVGLLSVAVTVALRLLVG